MMSAPKMSSNPITLSDPGIETPCAFAALRRPNASRSLYVTTAGFPCARTAVSAS